MHSRGDLRCAAAARTQVLLSVAEKIKNYGVVYVVDTDEVCRTPCCPNKARTHRRERGGRIGASCTTHKPHGAHPPRNEPWTREKRTPARLAAAHRGMLPRSFVISAQVNDFNTMYELYDPCTVMFFFRNKHIMIDLGTGAPRPFSHSAGVVMCELYPTHARVRARSSSRTTCLCDTSCTDVQLALWFCSRLFVPAVCPARPR